MLSIVAFIFLVSFILRYPKKGIIFVAMIVQPLTYLGSGIGEVSMYYLLATIALVLVVCSKGLNFFKNYPILLLRPTMAMAISYLVTDFLASHSNTVIILANIVTQFLFPIVLWNVLDHSNNVRYALKLLVVFSAIVLVVMVPELLLKHNYFTDIVLACFKTTDFVIDANAVRFGLKRTNSIFSYFSTMGVYCYLATYVIWLMVVKFDYKSKLVYSMMYLLPFAAFATGSRAIFLGLFCIVIALFTKSEVMKSKTSKGILVACLLLFPVVVSYFGNVIFSMVDSDSSEAVGGSSASLRFLQWECCLPSFLQSPIWGNGRMYIWDEVAPEHPMLKGAESLWFSLLVDYGIMGAITYTIMIVCSAIFLSRYNKRLAFLPVGYFLILSLSPDAGIQYNQLLTFVVLLSKIYQYPINKRAINFSNNYMLTKESKFLSL